MIKHSIIFTFSSYVVLLSAPFAHAVTVIMEQGPSGDRIRIVQEEGDQNIQSLRVSPDTLFVQVDNASQVPVATPESVNGTLINGFISHNDGVSVSLGDSAFGFIQSQDANGDILIDIYPDEMGARWRQSEVAREAYTRLEEQQALPSQNPNFPQFQNAQTISNISQNQNPNLVNPALETNQTNQTNQNSQINQNLADIQTPLETPREPETIPTQVSQTDPLASTQANTVPTDLQTVPSLPNLAQAQVSQEPNLSSEATPPPVDPINSQKNPPNSTSPNTAPVQNTTNLPAISQNSGHNSNLGTGIHYMPAQSETNQAEASNPVSNTRQVENVDSVEPSQSTMQNMTNVPSQNTVQIPLFQDNPQNLSQNAVQNPVQTSGQSNSLQASSPQMNITQTNPAQTAVPTQTPSTQTNVPAQNINITLDNQTVTQNPSSTGQVIQENQTSNPPQININLSQETITTPPQNSIPPQNAVQTPIPENAVNLAQNQGTNPDININLQTQNGKESVYTNDIALPTSTQNTAPSETPQEININISNRTQEGEQAPQAPQSPLQAPLQASETQTSQNQDINITIDNTTTQTPVSQPEEIEVPNVTSFTFSLSDQVESEASVIDPQVVIAKQMEEEAKVINARLQTQGLIQGDNAEKTPAIGEDGLVSQTQQPIQTPAQDMSQTIVQDSATLAIQDNAILNPALDPVLDETGLPVQADIIYLDEEGNVVPAPLNIPKTLEDMRTAEKGFNYQNLLQTTDLLRDKPLPSDLLEEVLYNRAIALYHLNQDNLFDKGSEIIRASADMINLNPSSKKVPSALSLMVPAAIAIDHIGEAKYAVDKLLTEYPQDEATPTATLLLAQSYLNDDEPINASKYLDILINDYPNSPHIQDAAILQTKSIYAQGDMNRTLTFLDFLDRRFDKVYITAPEYFTIRGKIEEDAKRYDKVASNYLTLYNLDPKGEMADFALDKVANAYYQLDQKDSARKILEELVESFPESPYRVSALMRIGENGRYDADMNLEEVFNLFNAPNPNLPNIFYNKIIEEYPDSQEAQTAKLRLAALSLWEKDFAKAADLALPIYNDLVGKKEGDRALEILLTAVEPLFALSISEKNYEHVLRIWEKYPPVHSIYTPYPDDLRMSLGRALLNRNQEQEGEEMLEPFLDEMPTNQEEFDNGLYAYSIILANALKRQDWGKVLETTEKVEGWDLPKDTGLQRLYSTALASQNLNLPARALPIWHALAPNPEVPLYQRAYAQYFLARDAERRQNLREAYQANLDTLAMFDDLYTQRSPYANLERNRESMAALMDLTEIAGRYTESMEWLNKYRYFVPTDSPDYPGLQLREARLHKKMGDDLRWRSILEQVRDKDPESVFGKMAASELASFEMARDLNRMTRTGR